MIFPQELEAIAHSRWDALNQKYPQQLAQWQNDAAIALHRVLACSDFITDALMQDADLLTWLYQHRSFLPRLSHYRQDLMDILATQTDEQVVMRQLRYFRRQEMVWLAWQDFNQQLPIEAGLAHLSALAEAMIMAAYDWLYHQCCQLWGTPCDENGSAQSMLILAMGKLGGEELNFSSDIDLIFTYSEEGETQGHSRSISNAQFFTRLAQRLIKLLDQKTVDGFCYRVDMRLRPFGESGPLVMSFAALEDYYQEQGRDWERYAMIKARVLGEEQLECYQTLRQLLRPFVFRRYIDFSAVQALRRMKGMIAREVRRRGLNDNIKLGAGGIREIEFIAQSFQLIRGGRESRLCLRQLLPTLDVIESLGLMSTEDVISLRRAYLFLRQLENRLQAIDDQQTQVLPSQIRDQARLAWLMGSSSWQILHRQIAAHMQQVHTIFTQIIGVDHEASDLAFDLAYVEVWEHAREPEWMAKILTDLGIAQAKESAQALFHFKQELAKRTAGMRGREVLNRLMPKLLVDLFQQTEQVQRRVFHLLLCVARRTTYLELLDEHPIAVTQLLRLCRASPMVAEQLATYPILLDELIDPAQLYHPTPFSQYRQQLFDYLARVPQSDMEQEMEMIRQFKQTQLLRIAAADIAGVLPLMEVSDHLTYLAEAIIEAVVNQAWFQMVAKYGKPCHLLTREGRGFAVVGYGKLGGIELAYGSDLDVVFIHDCPENVETDGEKSIDGRQFYLRLAQRIVHLFSTRTPSGVLYDIDTRLRPSGASGMLATTLAGFEAYQLQQAWTWEHQALVRARVIYGDVQLTTDFNQVRHQVLTQARDQAKLAQLIVEMREKMRVHLARQHTGSFDLKQDRGGITDIEFLTQFWVLSFSHQYPELTQWSDNIRILAQLAELNLIPKCQADTLIEAYVRLRNIGHRLNLKEKALAISGDKLQQERANVMQIWTQWFGETA